MTYAKGTQVSIERSRAEIEMLVKRYGASRFATGWDTDSSVIFFEHGGKRIKFVLPLPDARDPKWRRTPTGRIRRNERVASAAYDDECRRRWRALGLVIKAKLEAVQSGIATFESEFLAHVVLPNGRTVGEELVPMLDKLTNGAAPLPPLLGM